jgi:hypothetical protein
MKKIYYIISVNERVYIHATLKEFLEYNIPCKDCLIQNMCLDYKENIHAWQLVINKPCKKLDNSIYKNKFFVNNAIKDPLYLTKIW